MVDRRNRSTKVPKKIAVPIGTMAQHTPYKSSKTWPKRIFLLFLGIIVFIGSALVSIYYNLEGKIHTLSVNHLLADSDTPSSNSSNSPSLPPDLNSGKAINIMVIGSDSRAGSNDVDGSGKAHITEGARSDTAIVVHISADRKHIDVVSIPRDMLVDRPNCKLSDGTTISGSEKAMFNSAFSVGGSRGDIAAGAACAIKTFEKFSNVPVHSFVVVDFSGLVNIVDSLGGVPLYVPFDVNDKYTQIKLKKGCQILDGTQALGWARARKSIGDGSDTGRIKRQQQIISAIAKEVLSSNIVTNPNALYSFLSASLGSVQTDQNLGSLRTMAGIANSIRTIKPNHIRFITMPWLEYGNRVLPSPQAQKIWKALLADQPLPAYITATGKPPLQPGDSIEISTQLFNKYVTENSLEGSPHNSSDASSAPTSTIEASADADANQTEEKQDSEKEETPTDTPTNTGEELPVCTK